jgi:hypothetical protein
MPQVLSVTEVNVSVCEQKILLTDLPENQTQDPLNDSPVPYTRSPINDYCLHHSDVPIPCTHMHLHVCMYVCTDETP